ncbi:response regulator [Defluviimonas sp. WL0002]|uniref:Response regulator n=1 Tax=Albidovulum marisflavi TaxID=2984159 RepID=A0ABT2ZFL4_9RHOB|nr:response regulator [Defluviimonas sp. WL0002]MCV2869566.1 response regulator [Defluviimonas sp. WL0002]
MADDLDAFQPLHRPDASAPLRGLTVLVLEDSRFASDALRLMCLRSGARVRRADCLRSAERHLSSYRPSVIIVDLGLPDGSGLDLIRRLGSLVPRVPVVLATSGDPMLASAACGAGAQGFLCKPIESLAAFQSAVIKALPRHARTDRNTMRDVVIRPDSMALREDLAQADVYLASGVTGSRLDYVAQFLAGLGRSARDRDLQHAAEALRGLSPAETAARVDVVRGLVSARLCAGD